LKNKEKERLDILLVKRGFYNSREKAKRAIMAGEVLIDHKKSLKVGQILNSDCSISLLKKKSEFVSRGGDKLNKAILEFTISVEEKKVIDVGASTGGFTDCLLRYGAKEVYCIDVGYGQLAWKLQKDSRVVVMDRTNIRYLKPEAFNLLFDLATIDVSFISLEKVIPVVNQLLTPEGEIIALIKPQFEAGKEYIQKGGIVKKPEVHQMVIEKISNLALSINFGVYGIIYSPLKGINSNIEYLIYLKKDLCACVNNTMVFQEIKKVVQEAHTALSLKKNKTIKFIHNK